ncbi:MAG: transcriptional repressor LexA [Bacilli bacterium]
MVRASAKAKQEAILSYIKEAVSARGYPPSVREIGDAVGLTSTSTVHGHLSKLEQRGLIRRDATKPRAIEITDDSFRAQPGQAAVPLLGKVTAGSPVTAIEDIEEYLPAPPHGRDSRDVFALRVVGDSMIDAGIHDGDIVYVRRQATADNGDIVVAMTEDDEATVKRFFKEKNHVRLQPENRTMQPMIFARVAILGKVIGLWRDMP